LHFITTIKNDLEGGNMNNLEHMLEISKEILTKFPQDHNIVRTREILSRAVEDDHKGVHFNEADLASFVYHNANNGKTDPILFGLYTGCLLSLLTTRREEQRKDSRVHIDGKGERFDYLFYGAQFVDELFVENVRGDNVCGYVSSFQGQGRVLITKNIQGKRTAMNIASSDGELSLYMAINNSGNEIASWAGSDGRICSMVLIGNSGENLAAWAGCTGEIKQLVAFQSYFPRGSVEAGKICRSRKAYSQYKDFIDAAKNSTTESFYKMLESMYEVFDIKWKPLVRRI
jgi:hypothetical protein